MERHLLLPFRCFVRGLRPTESGLAVLGFSETRSGRALRGGALLVLLPGLVVVLGLAAGRAVDLRPEVPPMMSSATSTVVGPESTDMATPIAEAAADDSGEPSPWWALAVVLLVGGVAAAALWRRVRRDDAPAVERPISMVEALEALRAGADYPSTIVGCWQGLEAWARDRGVARGRAETVEEFSTCLASEVSLDAEALVALGVLYQRARYAPTRPRSRDREQAVACLKALVGDRSVRGGTDGR